MKRGRSTLWLSLAFAFVFAISVAWFVLKLRGPIGQKVVLNDGTQLTLYGVTHGAEHYMTSGRPWDYLLGQVPEGWMPKWTWLQNSRARFRKTRLVSRDDKLVVWLKSITPLNAPAAFRANSAIMGGFGPQRPGSGDGVPWTIAAPESLETGAILQMPFPPGTMNVFPIVINSYPRRASRFAFKLYQPRDADLVSGREILAKEFVIENSKISDAPYWTPEPLPSRKVNEGLTCVLRELRVLPRDTNAAIQSAMLGPVPSMWCEAIFEVFENGAPVSHWSVQGIKILDPTGNATRAGASKRLSSAGNAPFAAGSGYLSSEEGWSTTLIRSTASAERFLLTETNGNRITCFSTPLWPDEPAWKIQVDLVQTGNFPAKAQLFLDELPFPPEPGTQRLIRETRISGRPVKVYAVGVIDMATARTRLPPSPASPYPSLVFEFDPNFAASNTVPFEMGTLEIRDENGQLLRTWPHSDVRPKYRDNWRLSFSELMDPRQVDARLTRAPQRDIKSIDVAVILPEQRMFEFVAKPTWMKGVSGTNGVSRP